MTATRNLETPALLEAARQEDGDRARELLVKLYWPMLRAIARQIAPQRTDLHEDLEQVGAIGLLRAIERFDPSLGKEFEPYAKALVAGEMRHYLRDAAPLVRLPRELVEMRSQVLQTERMLLSEGHDPVTPAMIAGATGLPEAKIAEVLALEEVGPPVSLDQESETERGTLRYQLVDSRYKSFQLATEDAIMLASALSRLRAASREVIEFAYYEDLTQTEIAKKLGISQMQVSRRLRSAVAELWKTLNVKLF